MKKKLKLNVFVPCRLGLMLLSVCICLHLFLDVDAQIFVPCDEQKGWIQSYTSGSCIKLIYRRAQWKNARAACRQLGGDLVKIVDGMMSQDVTSVIVHNRQRAYIGLRRPKDDVSFYWLDEKEPVRI
ncbi:macrophage mannose receptor 1 [Elysia marginata]|uniref:Macrophage mannose receptor 1 n=1 Tax=Elysia marginata TaxID=1093978 RepID=A0AAV4JKV7_9GAST|nr:macrophage mannose receptor 1 [Elysia marginata]